MALTVEKLRAELVALLADKTGQYGTLPSVWISPPLPPKGTKGIEVIISREPLTIKEQQLSAGQRLTNRRWELRLTDHASGDEFDVERSISACVAAIRARFPVSSVVHLPPSDETYEQARISIYDPIVFNGV